MNGQDTRKSNDTLAQRLKDRDPQAMADCYDLYGRLAYAIVLRIVRDRAIAEDLTQEAFLRIWNHAQSFDEQRSSLPQWVAAISRNRAYDYLRSVECRMTREAVDLDHAGAQAFSAGWQDMADADLLRKAMTRLTPDQQLALDLWYREGMTHAEIAQRTKTPLGTVKTRLRATLRAMREQIQCPLNAEPAASRS